jgi:hypothetical protein
MYLNPGGVTKSSLKKLLFALKRLFSLRNHLISFERELTTFDEKLYQLLHRTQK